MVASTPRRRAGPPPDWRDPGGAGSPSAGTRIVPRARPVPSRTIPRRSASAVAASLTRESASSIQSTGTSWIRRPARSASTSNSVSKNQPVSRVSGSSARAASARIALNPHCASENPVPRLACSRSEEHTSELQSHVNLVCRLLLEKKKKKYRILIEEKKELKENKKR